MAKSHRNITINGSDNLHKIIEQLGDHYGSKDTKSAICRKTLMLAKSILDELKEHGQAHITMENGTPTIVRKNDDGVVEKKILCIFHV